MAIPLPQDSDNSHDVRTYHIHYPKSSLPSLQYFSTSWLSSWFESFQVVEEERWGDTVVMQPWNHRISFTYGDIRLILFTAQTFSIRLSFYLFLEVQKLVETPMLHWVSGVTNRLISLDILEVAWLA
jgi:hypothetical protein